ncbi:MAG TPA: mandelate racemase/muconate lactonizing enzyme family protein, partial [Solirubrobacteraceae bacterium]
GLGEATLNGFGLAVEAAVHELEHFAIGADPTRVTHLGNRLFEGVSNDGGQIHRTAIAGIEIACWDILGQSLGAPIHALAGGRVRDSVPVYANGWYRTERSPETVLAVALHARSLGFGALKIDPFGTAEGFVDSSELNLAVDIMAALRDGLGPDVRLLVDAHARFTEAEAVRVAGRMAPLDIFWLEEPTSRERIEPTTWVAQRSAIRIASGETFDSIGQFHDLVAGGGVNILQPEPMSLGGIGPTLAVAAIARGAGGWIAPHQSGGPVATAVCLQLAACVPNFLIQEYFDPFNEPWTRDLLSWTPTIDHETGHVDLPSAPGLGVTLNLEVAGEHPYDPKAFLDVHEAGWEQRLGSGSV